VVFAFFKDCKIKIYVRFLLVVRPTILVREDRIRAMPYPDPYND